MAYPKKLPPSLQCLQSEALRSVAEQALREATSAREETRTVDQADKEHPAAAMDAAARVHTDSKDRLASVPAEAAAPISSPVEEVSYLKVFQVEGKVMSLLLSIWPFESTEDGVLVLVRH
jgi:hypothetical protein